MIYYVTRARRDWTPGQPHPGYDEYKDGKPTGRVVGAGATMGVNVSDSAAPNTPVQMSEAKALWDRATQRWKDQDVPYLSQDYKFFDEILIQEVGIALAALSPRPTLHSGLRRDLAVVDKLRIAIAKLDQGSRLADDELKRLIKFYGILVMAGDIIGQSYALFTADVEDRHRKLMAIATERGWTQALINMYGVSVRDVFQLSP